MAIDIVTELREQQRVQRQPNGNPTYLSDLPGRAADEIERLRAEVARLNDERDHEWAFGEKERAEQTE